LEKAGINLLDISIRTKLSENVGVENK